MTFNNLEYMRNYRKENREEYNQYMKDWRLGHLEQAKFSQQKTYQKNKEYYKTKQRKYYEINKEQELIKHREYRKKHPEKFLKYMQDYKKRTGLIFGRMSGEWAKTIKKRDNNACQICGNIAEHSHHILYRKNFPHLQFVINNGIALCKKCHYQTHGSFT